MIDIRGNTAKLLKSDYGIDEETTVKLFETGVLQDHVMRNVLMRKDYERQISSKEKQRVRGKLAERYCVSVSLVEKTVLKKT